MKTEMVKTVLKVPVPKSKRAVEYSVALAFYRHKLLNVLVLRSFSIRRKSIAASNTSF
jgi:hypothetical protein